MDKFELGTYGQPKVDNGLRGRLMVDRVRIDPASGVIHGRAPASASLHDAKNMRARAPA